MGIGSWCDKDRVLLARAALACASPTFDAAVGACHLAINALPRSILPRPSSHPLAPRLGSCPWVPYRSGGRRHPTTSSFSEN